MGLNNPYQAEDARHWNIQDGTQLIEDRHFDVDVLIIGSGAGGGISAEILSRAGKQVLIMEEGALRTSSDFRMAELEAYQQMYQEGMTRSTRDGTISLLQGRTVGGSTTVNWTSSFRTPRATLEHWQSRWGVLDCGEDELRPYFERMEAQLGIFPWQSPNANNQALAKGCAALDWTHGAIPRNVRACWNLGACGIGCPTNAKQSTLVQSIPAALRAGAILLHRVKAHKLRVERDRVVGVEAIALDLDGKAKNIRVTVKAKEVILAAGAIGSPAILLRSEEVPKPYRLVGTRTFLHPSVFVFAQFQEQVAAFEGAPQSVYSDHFQWKYGVEGPMGFKLEAVPMLPLFAALIMRGHGVQHAERMAQLPFTAGALALLRDGFHEESVGGRVTLTNDEQASLDYPISQYLFDGVRRAFLSLTELYFAAGAQRVHLAHAESQNYADWATAKEAITNFRYEPLRLRLGSAHVMGGCRIGSSPEQSVVDSNARYHQLENLSIFDGSIFPTSLGVNPQLTIFALSAKFAEGLAAKM